MTERKESRFAFPEEGKESFRTRLASLIGTRSVRTAAKDWGLPASTINNYLHKGTEPALRVAMTIAEAEKVGLEWLAFGLNKEEISSTNSSIAINDSNADPLRNVWAMIYDSIERHDAEALIKLIHKNGARGVISAASAVDELNYALLILPDEEKERLLALHEAKKGASQQREINVSDTPASKKRQAS